MSFLSGMANKKEEEEKTDKGFYGEDNKNEEEEDSSFYGDAKEEEDGVGDFYASKEDQDSNPTEKVTVENKGFGIFEWLVIVIEIALIIYTVLVFMKVLPIFWL
ncbi:hypothetical protein K9M79_06775 [Candidatus Woesearchaeota archaeon]|nr:hypothetical protein [Candidatus Woesearchaeota archaeon]